MGHSVWGLSTEDRPADAGTLSTNWRWSPKQAAGNRRTMGVNGFATCRLWRQPVAFGGERAAHLSRPPDGREKRFCPLLGLRPKGGAARHPCIIVLNMTAPHTCRAGVSADKPAAVLCLMSGSQPLLYAHKRGEKALSLLGFSRQTKSQAISTPRFSLCDKLSGWPASGFRVLSQRDIYGTFCLGSIC